MTGLPGLEKSEHNRLVRHRQNYRFDGNQYFDVSRIYRLAFAAVQIPPMPYRLLKLAEDGT